MESMWLKIKKIFLYFINKGTEYYDTPEDKQRVQLINLFILLPLFFLLPTAIIQKAFIGAYWEAAVATILLLMLLLVIFFNHRGKNQIATLICIISPILITNFVVFYIDRQVQTAAPYLNLYVGVGAFFLIQNSLLKNILSAIGFLSFAITNYYQLSYLPFEKREYSLVILILILIYIAFKHFASELNKSRAKVTEKNKRLLELNREKDGMLGIVAHDLRAPFNQIKGLFHLMAMDAITKSKQKDLIDRINNSLDQANTLIGDLLDINNFQQQDTFKFNAERINLIDFLQHLNDNYKQLANNKQQLLKCTTDAQSDIITDKFLLTRIMENLLSNAIKFSPPLTSINVSIKQEGEKFIISVKDEGPGFTVSDKAKVFGKFQKLSAKPTGGEYSTGLGLSIIKSLVDKLQGSIELFSENGQGSEFVLTFRSLTPLYKNQS